MNPFVPPQMLDSKNLKPPIKSGVEATKWCQRSGHSRVEYKVHCGSLPVFETEGLKQCLLKADILD